jgi:hypothetical protein
MFYKQIQLHLIEIEATLETAFRYRLVSDVNALGGAIIEQEMCDALTDDRFVCLTNRMVETMVEDGIKFIFPNGEDLKTILKLTKQMDNEYYATDLFLFKRNKNSYKYVDSISLKTSFSKGDVMVNLVNDAEGDCLWALKHSEDVYLGQTFLILVNTDTGEFEMVWIDDTIQGLVGRRRFNIKNDGSHVFKTCEFDWGKGRRNVQAVVVTDRAKRTNKTSASSFNRGVKIRKDLISNFGETFAEGFVRVDKVRSEVVSDLSLR